MCCIYSTIRVTKLAKNNSWLGNYFWQAQDPMWPQCRGWLLSVNQLTRKIEVFRSGSYREHVSLQSSSTETFPCMGSFWKLTLLEGWLSVTNAVCFLSFDHFSISEGQTVKKGHLRLTVKSLAWGRWLCFATKRFLLCGLITRHSSHWPQYFKSM